MFSPWFEEPFSKKKHLQLLFYKVYNIFYFFFIVETVMLIGNKMLRIRILNTEKSINKDQILPEKPKHNKYWRK